MADGAVATTTGQEEVKEFQVGDGSVVKYRNNEELLTTLAKMKTDTATALKLEREARAKAEGLAQTLADAATTKATPKEGEFNTDIYWKMMNSGDVVGAQNFVDAYRYGLTPEEVVPTLTSAVQTIGELRDRSELADFRSANVDWPGGKENGDKLLKWVRDEWQKPWDASVLTHGFRELARRGEVKALEIKTEKEEETAVPPRLGGASATRDDGMTDDKFLKLTSEERLDYIRKNRIL